MSFENCFSKVVDGIDLILPQIVLHNSYYLTTANDYKVGLSLCKKKFTEREYLHKK